MPNRQETIIPTSYPAAGFKFHEPNYKDIAPRLGATYRLGEKTVLRAGFGIYYNPNQMNSFTFLTNNPPLAAVSTFSSEPTQPDAVLREADRRGRAGRSSRRDLADSRSARTPARTNGASTFSASSWPGTALDLQYVGSNTSNLDRSFFNNTPQPGPGAVDPRRPSQHFRSAASFRTI